MAQYLRRSTNRFLKHRYTWIDDDSVPVLDVSDQPTYDSNGIPITTDASPVTEKKCLFLYETITNNENNILMQVPTLYVPYDDPVSERDLIRNVVTQSGVILLDGAMVETVDFTSDIGENAMKVLRLSGAKTV